MKSVLIIILSFLSIGVYAQSIDSYVIGAVGGQVSTANLEVNFTAGESVIQTASLAQVILTQGFHQPPSALSGLDEMVKEERLHVFPNPTSDQLYVTINNSDNQTVIIEVYSLNGQLVFKEDANMIMQGETIQLNVSNLNPGHYQIRIANENGLVQHAKFVKS